MFIISQFCKEKWKSMSRHSFKNVEKVKPYFLYLSSFRYPHAKCPRFQWGIRAFVIYLLCSKIAWNKNVHFCRKYSLGNFQHQWWYRKNKYGRKYNTTEITKALFVATLIAPEPLPWRAVQVPFILYRRRSYSIIFCKNTSETSPLIYGTKSRKSGKYNAYQHFQNRNRLYFYRALSALSSHFDGSIFIPVLFISVFVNCFAGAVMPLNLLFCITNFLSSPLPVRKFHKDETSVSSGTVEMKLYVISCVLRGTDYNFSTSVDNNIVVPSLRMSYSRFYSLILNLRKFG